MQERAFEDISEQAEARRHRILIVDDEAENLDLLASTLRRGNDIFKAQSGEAAMEILDKEEIHMLITDQRMPGISGTELLEKFREINDHAIRMLITGYADMKVAVDAINKGQVHRYISKPWDPAELRKIVAMELERYDLHDANRRLTKELIEKNERLESMNRELQRKNEEIERLANEQKQARDRALQMSEKLAKNNLELLKAQEEIKLQNVKLEAANKKLERLSITDGLTGFYNNRYMHQLLDSEMGRAKRYDLNLSVIMLDLDTFKEVNDTYGHPFGDIVLKHVTENIRHNIRETDWPTRYGGDEFVVILPHTGVERATYMAKRIHADVKATVLTAPNGDLIRPTVSVGIAYYPHHSTSTKEEMISLVDQALYQAKQQGRDRIVVAE